MPANYCIRVKERADGIGILLQDCLPKGVDIHDKTSEGIRRLKVKSTCKWLIYNFEECVNQLANGGLKLPTDSEIQQDDNKRYLIHPIDAISYPMHYLSSLRAIAGEQESL